MERKLRFGLLFDFRNPPQWLQPWAKFYAGMIDFAAWTESLGFDDVWLSEHHCADDGYIPSPLVAATAIAVKTKRIRIGTAIATAPFYHPVRLAEDAAVLDIISGGRLELGLGLGYRQEEFTGYGLSLDGRGALTSEVMQILRRLWDGEVVTFKGRFFKLEKARIMPRPTQAHLPLWVGGFNRQAFRRAALYGDGIIGGGDMAARYHGYLAELAAAGKDPATARLLCGLLWFLVSEDPEKTFAEVAPHILHQINTYAQWLQSTTHQIFTPADTTTLKASGQLKIVTPEEAIAIFRNLIATVPIEGIYGMVPPAGFPLERFAQHVELFANKVIPAFR
jgi:alkanesulfonate monooxygenase SsuD/methylene tetrahydromethanopterin reductase-like flavin-dependent oxidoreductase (luciferase family)